MRKQHTSRIFSQAWWIEQRALIARIDKERHSGEEIDEGEQEAEGNDKKEPSLTKMVVKEWVPGTPYSGGELVLHPTTREIISAKENQNSNSSFDFDEAGKWSPAYDDEDQTVVEDFEPLTKYVKNELVLYAGASYRAKKAFTSTLLFEHKDWDATVLIDRSGFRGTYSSDSVYLKGDFVEKDLLLFKANGLILAETFFEVGKEGATWSKVSESIEEVHVDPAGLETRYTSKANSVAKIGVALVIDTSFSGSLTLPDAKVLNIGDKLSARRIGTGETIIASADGVSKIDMKNVRLTTALGVTYTFTVVDKDGVSAWLLETVEPTEVITPKPVELKTRYIVERTASALAGEALLVSAPTSAVVFLPDVRTLKFGDKISVKRVGTVGCSIRSYNGEARITPTGTTVNTEFNVVYMFTVFNKDGRCQWFLETNIENPNLVGDKEMQCGVSKIPACLSRVTFPTSFSKVPIVVGSAMAGVGITFAVGEVNATGFTAVMTNRAGYQCAGDFNWIAMTN